MMLGGPAAAAAAAAAAAGGGGDGMRTMLPASGIGGGTQQVQAPGTTSGRGKEEAVRVPQWSPQETRELIAIRGELERDFTASKRNKTLWDLVAARMRERGGYRRTPDQCKCKWKNLVNRYKGKETFDPENGKQCPFFEELHAVFTERARNMQRQLLESESGASHAKKKLKKISGDKSSEEASEDEDEDDEDSDDDSLVRSRKRKGDREQQQPQQQRSADKSRVTHGASSIHDLLRDFLQQQQRMEVQWQEMMERRARERLLFEQEWRQSMEKLERERMMLEQAWREMEKQRRITEEARAEKRDQLLTSLLNKLLQENL